MKRLLEDPRVSPYDLDFSALDDACSFNAAEIVKFLLYEVGGFDQAVQKDSLLIDTTECGHIDVVETLLLELKSKGLLTKEKLEMCFKAACRMDHLEIVKYLIETFEVEPDLDKSYSFRVACHYRYHDMIRFFLQVGVHTSSLQFRLIRLPRATLPLGK